MPRKPLREKLEEVRMRARKRLQDRYHLHISSQDSYLRQDEKLAQCSKPLPEHRPLFQGVHRLGQYLRKVHQELQGETPTKKLTILHSNDLHGDFLAETIDNELLGGVSRLSGYINKVRQEEEHVLYAIAGDMFRGSIIDTEYKGMSTIEIMNALSPDVVTIGNHEIDYGIPHLLFLEKCALFPIINANLYITTNYSLLFPSHHVITIGGLKVLFIGVITEEILQEAKSDSFISKFIDVQNPLAAIGRICNSYRRDDIDLTILLTHIGFTQDQELARQLDPDWGIDLIIGGHSHTLLTEPCRINDILIVQAGMGTDQIGRFDLTLAPSTKEIVDYTWQCIPITPAYCPVDEQLEAILNRYLKETDAKYGRVLTRFNAELTHPSRHEETALGNLLADILKNELNLDIMLLGSGSIRTKKLGPIVTKADFLSAFPFDDAIIRLTITGKTFRNMMAFLLREEAFFGNTEFYQLSFGTRVVYDRATQTMLSLTYQERPIADDDILTVGLQRFHFLNIEEFFHVREDEYTTLHSPQLVTTSENEVIEEFMNRHRRIFSMVEGRITILNEPPGPKENTTASP